jgi:hypothetical protein
MELAKEPDLHAETMQQNVPIKNAKDELGLLLSRILYPASRSHGAHGHTSEEL